LAPLIVLLKKRAKGGIPVSTFGDKILVPLLLAMRFIMGINIIAYVPTIRIPKSLDRLRKSITTRMTDKESLVVGSENGTS